MTIHLDKINGFGGGNGGGGGSSSFPITVTDSGSSLPVDLSGYNEGDTFLNTSDKKIYTVGEGVVTYKNNTNVYSSGVSVNLTTGIASTFTSSNYIYRTVGNSGNEWSGSGVKYQVHFKITSFSGWSDTKYHPIIRSVSQYQISDNATAVAIKQKELYLVLGYKNSSTISRETKLFDYELLENTEYYFTITKNGTSAFAELFVGGYDGILVASGNIETENWVTTASGRDTSIRYGLNIELGSSSVWENIIDGEIYLLDSSGELLVEDTITYSWDSGTDLTDKTEYADKTNGILYLYQDTELIQIPDIDLSNYKLKAETITISTASVTIANVQANKNYVLSSSALTDITLTACETSFEETSINFTTGSSAPTFTDNASIKWFGGVPEMKANTTYTIVIFNKQAYWQEQENV